MTSPYDQPRSSASNPSNQQPAPSGSTEFQWTMTHLNKLDDKVTRHVAEISELTTTIKHQNTASKELKDSVNSISNDVEKLKMALYTTGIVISVVLALGVFFFGSTVQDVMSSIKALSELQK
ncbi:hypothetical protein ACRTC7_10950 [Vibrio fluvialis]|uniref:hypothetical protein n=1 Tax=Vibrio fluvialis TaxID=676 RepID=UPI003D7D69DF